MLLRLSIGHFAVLHGHFIPVWKPFSSADCNHDGHSFMEKFLVVRRSMVISGERMQIHRGVCATQHNEFDKHVVLDNVILRDVVMRACVTIVVVMVSTL